MKKVLLILVLLCLCGSLRAQQDTTTVAVPAEVLASAGVTVVIGEDGKAYWAKDGEILTDRHDSLSLAQVTDLESVFGAERVKGADTIRSKDPVGIYVTIVSVVTVLCALVALFLLIQLFANIMVKSAQKKASQTKAKSMVVDDMKVTVPIGCDSLLNGEIIAAIGLAVKLERREVHDRESDVITINKVARVYSPWSSKIHGLTPIPDRK